MDSPDIRLLPPEVIDQIAAGEVVERPASVVKELVENAIDAGARQVSVEVEGGGKELIRVVDDGVGMSPEQAALALKRHATSKLRHIDDLFGIATMGFRGEALASIAAVSRLTLTTRPRAGSVGATCMIVEGGSVASTTTVGAPTGTAIEVRDLLYNVPARQKFLKGDATEVAHIGDTITKIALAHPDVHLRLRSGGRTTIHAPVHQSRLERAMAVLGAKVGTGLSEVVGEERGVNVVALLAPPDRAQTTSRGTLLFVGRRPVRDRGLLHAVCMGYGELVAKGRYPVAVVFVDVPDPELDVNVHPQKLEVRFADPQRVYAAVRHTITRGTAEAPWLQEQQAQGPAPVSLRTWQPLGPGQRASELAERYARDTTRMLIPWRAARMDPARPAPRAQAVSAPRQGALDVHPPAPVARAPMPSMASVTAAPPAEPTTEVDGFFGQLRYIGQLDRTYLVCERDGEMVLIDQHAAHERVAFARLKKRYQERQVPVQRLLFPQTIELEAEQAAVAAEHGSELAAMGFEVEPFGDSTWAIKAVPADVREQEVAEVLDRLLSELAAQGGSRAVEERIDNALATIACHSVVRAGDLLSAREAEALLVSLDGIPFRGYCPHGRPVLLRMRVDEIARRFGRT